MRGSAWLFLYGLLFISILKLVQQLIHINRLHKVVKCTQFHGLDRRARRVEHLGDLGRRPRRAGEQRLGAVGEGILRGNAAISPYLKGELVIVGSLPDAGIADDIVDALDGGEYRRSRPGDA